MLDRQENGLDLQLSCYQPVAWASPNHQDLLIFPTCASFPGLGEQERAKRRHSDGAGWRNGGKLAGAISSYLQG